MSKMTEADKVAKYGPIVVKFGSKSEPDKEPYEVRTKNGVHTCNCKGFVFSKKSPKVCRHIEYMLTYVSAPDALNTAEIEIIENVLGAADLLTRLRNMYGAAGWHDKLKLMADVLRPYLGSGVAAAPTATADEGFRFIMLD